MKSLLTDHRLIVTLLVLSFASGAPAAPPAATPPVSASATAAAKQIYTKAMAAAQSGDYIGAVTLCRQAIRAVPAAAPIWATLARLLAIERQFPDAITAAQTAVGLSPKTGAFQADLSEYLLQSGNAAQAETTARKALTLEPKSDNALSTLATCLMRAHHSDEAIPILRRLLAVRGGADRAVGQGLIAAQLQTGDGRGALATAKSIAILKPKDAELALDVADLASRVNDAASVREAADKLEALAPKSPLPFYYRGRLYFTDTKMPVADRLKKAEEQFQKAVNLAPDEPMLRSQLGVVQVFEGKDHFDAARTNLNDALLRNNHDAVARQGLALIGEKTEDWDGAAVQYEALLRLNPNDSNMRRRYAGVLLSAHRKEEAYRQFHELATRNPKDITYLKELASFLLVDKSYPDARAAYAQVLERAPGDADALLGTAHCFSDEGNLAKASDLYEQAIAASPKRETAYVLLAQLYSDSGDGMASITVLERLLKAVPDNNAGRMMLIDRYILLNRDDDAKREIAKLTLRKGDPNRTAYRLAMGHLLMVRKKYTEAADEFARIASEEPDNADVVLALADADSKAGKADAAHDLYERAVRTCETALLKNPGNAGLRAALIHARTAEGTPEKAGEFLQRLGANLPVNGADAGTGQAPAIAPNKLN